MSCVSDTPSAPSASLVRRRAVKDLRPSVRMTKAAMREVGAAPGRPLAVMTQEQRTELVGAFERGADVLTACDSAGVGYQVFGRIMQDEPAFRDAIKKAQAVHIQAALSRLRELPAGRWQAAAWELERIYPDRFGQGSRPDLSGPVVKVEVTATVCAQMHESWTRFASQVVDLKPVVESANNNSSYVQSKIVSNGSPTPSTTSEESVAKVPQGTSVQTQRVA